MFEVMKKFCYSRQKKEQVKEPADVLNLQVKKLFMLQVTETQCGLRRLNAVFNVQPWSVLTCLYPNRKCPFPAAAGGGHKNISLCSCYVMSFRPQTSWKQRGSILARTSPHKSGLKNEKLRDQKFYPPNTQNTEADRDRGRCQERKLHHNKTVWQPQTHCGNILQRPHKDKNYHKDKSDGGTVKATRCLSEQTQLQWWTSRQTAEGLTCSSCL